MARHPEPRKTVGLDEPNMDSTSEETDAWGYLQEILNGTTPIERAEDNSEDDTTAPRTPHAQ